MQNHGGYTVEDRAGFEPTVKLGYDTEDIRLRVAEMASYFGIRQWFYKSVEELSGGQKAAFESGICHGNASVTF